MQLAVEYYEASARLQNSSGLTISAYYYLFPHWFDELKNIVKRDDDKGRKYLDAAQRYDNPATQFVTGIALYGQGKYEKNEAEGLKLINVAACRGNNWATDFFKSSTKHKPVLCKP
jgi:hypothetical protein